MGLFQVGRYEIISEIGRGGMATVYLGRDPNINRDVAIKILPAELLHDPSFRTRFEREARTIAALEHPAIVPVYDFGEHDGQPYFVMRLMTGKSLAERIARGPISLREVVNIISRVSQALDEAHSKGIVHRDLKPGNILFDQHGEPYLSDFGIAKLSEAGSTNITGGAIVGTPAYMSPEQALGEADIDGRSDVYSLGVILFEMLAGKVPFEADTPMGQALKHVTETAPSVVEVNQDLPPELAHVVEKAMAKRKFARYSSAGDLSRDLAAILEHDKSMESESFGAAVSGRDEASLPGGAARQRSTPRPSRPGTKPPSTYPQRITPSSGSQPVNTPLSMVKGTQSKQKPVSVSGKQRINQRLVWLILIIVVVGGGLTTGALLLLNQKPAGRTEVTETVPSATEAVSLQVPVAEIISPTPVHTKTPLPPTSTATAAPLATSTQEQLLIESPVVLSMGPAIGGADKIAFIRGKEIWIMNLDGSELTLVTQAGGSKSNLQWALDGKSILYISGKSIHQVGIENPDVDDPGDLILTVNWSDYLAGFQISSDAKYMALSLSDGLFILKYDPIFLKQVRRPEQLKSDSTCLAAPTIKAKAIQWSDDNTSLAAVVIGTQSGKQVEVIRVLNVSQCNQATKVIDEFPANRFEMEKYAENPVIQSFGWDGNFIFALNVSVFNSFGTIFEYNMASHRHKIVSPLGNACCFRDFQWSPDDTYFLFSFKDSRYGNNTELYYVEFGTIGTGVTYTPLPLPENFFTDVNDRPQPVLRLKKP